MSDKANWVRSSLAGFQVIQKEQISNFVILKDIQVGENVQNYLNWCICLFSSIFSTCLPRQEPQRALTWNKNISIAFELHWQSASVCIVKNVKHLILLHSIYNYAASQLCWISILKYQKYATKHNVDARKWWHIQ